MVNKKTGQTGVGYITVSRRKNIANSVRALRQWKTRAARVCRGWPPVAQRTRTFARAVTLPRSGPSFTDRYDGRIRTRSFINMALFRSFVARTREDGIGRK